MALPAKPFRVSIVLVLAAVGVAAANTQSLNQSDPLDRLSDVVQFGVPHDAKFAFCDEEDYPECSIKHLHVLPPPPPVVQEPVMSTPQSIRPPEKLSHMKVPAKKKPLKKKRKKPAIQYEYEPVSKPR